MGPDSIGALLFNKPQLVIYQTIIRELYGTFENLSFPTYLCDSSLKFRTTNERLLGAPGTNLSRKAKGMAR
jgi:hypothetical protein